MKKSILCGLLIAAAASLSAQKYFTKDGTIHFYSDAKLEKIDATNNKASIVLDASTGAIEIAVLIKGFVFENAFMGEHFNETYMESDKFPKANFKGKIENPALVKFNTPGTYKAKVVGDLTMHGVTKPVSSDATFTVAAGTISTDSKFVVKASDYGIKIPSDKTETISNVIDVTCKSKLTELKK